MQVHSGKVLVCSEDTIRYATDVLRCAYRYYQVRNRCAQVCDTSTQAWYTCAQVQILR